MKRRNARHSPGFAGAARAAAICLALITPAYAGDDISASADEAAADPRPTLALNPARLTAAMAAEPTEGDLAALKAAVSHYERGQVAEGDRAIAAAGHPLARLAGEWSLVRLGLPQTGSARVAAFLDANPDWSAPAPIQRRAEEALIAERARPQTVLAFFASRRPLTPPGRRLSRWP